MNKRKRESEKRGKKAGERKAAERSGPKPASQDQSVPSGEGARLIDWVNFTQRLPSWWPLPLFMLVGLIFRLSVTLWEPEIYPDALQYMHLAQEIRSGVFFGPNFDLDQGFIKSRHLPPFYSFLLAPFAGPSDHLAWVGRTISLLFSLLTFIPLWLIATRVFSRRSAVLACAFFSFHYFALWYSWPILSEPVFTFLFMSVIAVSVFALCQPGYKLFIAGGVLSAFLYMTRDVGITAAPLIALAAGVKFIFLDKLGWRRVAGLIAALLVAFLLASVPYLIHIRLRTGEWNLTVQMENTSITRQIQLFGGDRYDRDRLPSRQKGTNLIGGEVASSVLELVRYAPALMKKLVLNMGSYGQQLARKWAPFFLALILISLAGILWQFLGDRNRERLFLELWVVGWILELWALYALITPYMVDERYMYPLMAPGLILASFGLERAVEWMLGRWKQTRSWQENAITLGIALLLAILFGIFVLPGAEEPEGIDKFLYIFPQHKPLVLFLIFLGLLGLFLLAFSPLPAFLISSRSSEGHFSGLDLGLAGALLVLGAIFLFALHPFSRFVEALPDTINPDEVIAKALRMAFLRLLPGLLLLGSGLAIGLSLFFSRLSSRGGWASVLCSGLFVALAFFSQVHDYLDLHHRMSNQGLPEKFASGYKTAANEIKARGLVPPGKIISCRKPFMAYYLNGKWFLDKAQDPPESMPKTIPEILDLISQGKIDYLAVDTFTQKTLRPLTTELALDLVEIPGARLIYTKFFPEYNRIICLYDCRQPEPPPLPRASAEEYYQAALAFFQNGELPFARREIKQGLIKDPNYSKLWLLDLEILQIYFQVCRRPGLASMTYMPQLLPQLAKASQEYARLAPDDAQANRLRDFWQKIYEQELSYLEQLKTKSKPKEPESSGPE